MQTEKVETADVSGKWSLSVDFQGQKFPVSLVLDQNNETVSGKLESMLGEGVVEDGKVKGNKFSAVAKSEMQGQKIELTISGTIENDSMNGSLSAPMIPMPLNFSGNREK